MRDSDPAYEVAETHAKAGGILQRVRAGARRRRRPTSDIAELVSDEDVLIALNSRNQRLSHVLADRPGRRRRPTRGCEGKSVVILDGEDDFVNMLRHVLGVLGMTSDGGPPRGLRAGLPRRLRPGDRRSRTGRPARRRPTRRSRAFRAAVDGAARRRAAVPRGLPRATRRCATGSGSRWPTRTSSSRAPSRRCAIDGRDRAGRLLQHVRRPGRRRRALPDGVRVETDPATGDIHLLVGPHYRGIQFHAESILTEHGYDLLHDLVLDLLARRRERSAPDVVVVDHHDSYTWNLVHLVAVGDRRAADRRPARRGRRRTRCCAHSHVVLSPGPGHPAIAADFAVGREVLLAGEPCRCSASASGMQGLVTAYGGTVDRVAPAHGVVARIEHDGDGRLRRAAAAVRRGALPLAGGARRCPTSLVVTALATPAATW